MNAKAETTAGELVDPLSASGAGAWCSECARLNRVHAPDGDQQGFLAARVEAIYQGRCRCDTTITRTMANAWEREFRPEYAREAAAVSAF